MGIRAAAVMQMVGAIEPMLLSLLAAVAVLLLIACVNTAQLQLAQLQRRRRELAVRCALGASGGRIVGGLVAEVALIATSAGFLGTTLAWAALRIIRTYGASRVPRLADTSFDGRIVLAAV